MELFLACVGGFTLWLLALVLIFALIYQARVNNDRTMLERVAERSNREAGIVFTYLDIEMGRFLHLEGTGPIPIFRTRQAADRYALSTYRDMVEWVDIVPALRSELREIGEVKLIK